MKSWSHREHHSSVKCSKLKSCNRDQQKKEYIGISHPLNIVQFSDLKTGSILTDGKFIGRLEIGSRTSIGQELTVVMLRKGR